MGIKEGGITELRAEIKKNMQMETERWAANRLKLDVLDKLVAANPIEVPQALIEGEIDRLHQMTRQQVATQTRKPEEAKKLELPREPYQKEAKKRVILGLLLAEVVKKHNIQVDADKLRARVEEIAKGYEKPEEVISWYYNNKRMLSEMESVVLEDQAVAQLMSELDIQDKDVSYQEAVKESQQREENE